MKQQERNALCTKCKQKLNKFAAEYQRKYRLRVRSKKLQNQGILKVSPGDRGFEGLNY